MPAETVHLLLRITARCSGTLFLVAFGIAGWASVLPTLRGLAARRRGLLLAFGAVHTVHAGLVVLLACVIGLHAFRAQFGIAVLLGGVLILMMWGLMADLLAPGRWPLVRTRAWRGITEWWFFSIFTLTFVVKSLQAWPLAVLGLLAVAAMAGRIAWYVSLRRQPAAGAPAS
jgi:hypothetical protein